MNARRLASLLGLLGLVSGAGAPAFAVDTPIQDIQLGLVDPNTIVTVENVVVTGVGVFGFFAQEPAVHPTFGRKWSGIWVFHNAAIGDIEEGDLVNFTGEYYEYFDFSEVDITDGSVTKVGTAAVPPSVFVPISTVNDSGVDAESYEGVLIKVDSTDPTLFARAPNTFNEWYVSTSATIGVGDSLLVDNYSGFDYDIPPAGTALSFVQGPLVYNFSQYKIAPRDCVRDLGMPCPPNLTAAYSTGTTSLNIEYTVPLDPVTHENPGNYELASGVAINDAELIFPNVIKLTTDPQENGAAETITVFASKSLAGVTGAAFQEAAFRAGITPIQMVQFVLNPASNDQSTLFDETVTVQGKVTAVEGTYYYLQDGPGTEWDGLYCRVARIGQLDRGDIVQVSGRVNEFNGSTQLNFRSGVNNYQNLGPGSPLVVTNLSAGQLKYNDKNTTERWENQLVRLTTGTVIDSCVVSGTENCIGRGSPSFGEYELRVAPTDTASVDLAAFEQVFYEPCTGDVLAARGIVRYEFSAYRVSTRDGDDLTVISGCNITDAPDGPAASRALGLSQNAPNPFRDQTEILLRLPQPAEIDIDVLDVAGRLVRTLASGPFAAGDHVLDWDGRSDAGDRVAAGTYFYRMRAAGQEFSRKMLVVR